MRVNTNQSMRVRWVDLLLRYEYEWKYSIYSIYMKSSDAKASKCHLKFSSKMTIFIKLVHLCSVISLK